MTRKQQATIHTEKPISNVKADHLNFEALIKALAYNTYWQTSDIANHPHYSIDYKETCEYISDHPTEPTRHHITETRLEIKTSGHFVRKAYLELPKTHQATIQSYLNRKPRPVKPEDLYAHQRWLIWVTDPEMLKITNIRRKHAGLPPLTEQQIQFILARIQTEMDRPEKQTNQKRANRHLERANTLEENADWLKAPFFVEPPDLDHQIYAGQLLGWRQLLYKLMEWCSLEVHTYSRLKPQPADQQETTEGPEVAPTQC